MTGSGYADLKQVKQRINISDSITQADAKIKNYMAESDDYVDVQAGVHTETPIPNPDKELVALASSLAASFYNYWNKQGEMKDCLTCKKSIQEHILAVYGQKSADGLSANTYSKIRGQVRGNESGQVN